MYRLFVLLKVFYIFRLGGLYGSGYVEEGRWVFFGLFLSFVK